MNGSMTEILPLNFSPGYEEVVMVMGNPVFNIGSSS